MCVEAFLYAQVFLKRGGSRKMPPCRVVFAFFLVRIVFIWEIKYNNLTPFPKSKLLAAVWA